MPGAAPDGTGVLIAEDLTPAEAAVLDPERVADGDKPLRYLDSACGN
jgi:hypothetical protein